MLDARQLEPALTEQDQILRDHFVGEYLKDFDAFKACMRLGFLSTYAVTWSQSLLNDGYVQRKLSFLQRKPDPSPEQDAIDKALVEQTLRMVMQKGSDSARVAAAREFNAMRGWSKPDGSEGNEDLAEAFRRVAQELPT